MVVVCPAGPHLNFSRKVVRVAFESLVSGPPLTLPPVNWVSVLGPIMRAEFGENDDDVNNVPHPMPPLIK